MMICVHFSGLLLYLSILCCLAGVSGFKGTQLLRYRGILRSSSPGGNMQSDALLVPLENEKSDNPIEFADDAPEVRWKATVCATTRVKEKMRSVEAYMALPSSEYSVLSAEQIERLSDSDFKCTLGTMNFFGTKITPVLYVDVTVYPDEAKSVIAVTRAETTGSEIARKVNGTFSISAVNVVTAGEDNRGRKTLTSDTKLSIDVKVPRSRIPLRVIRSGGNFIVQSSLNVIVPAFIRILAADFGRWTAGSDERSEVDGADLSV